MGKLLTCLPRLTLAQLRTLWSTRGCMPQRPCKVPIAPRGDSRLFCSFLQGGGVIVSGGRVAISSCTIRGNTASIVRVQSSHHHPHGRLTFCFLFAGRRCLCPGWHSDHLIMHLQWELWFCACLSSNFPIAPMGCRESRLPTLRCSDHCDLAFLIPCPGGQCLCPRRHGLLLGNDPHRRLWHSLSLPSTPPSAAAIATAIATPFATAPLAAALTSTTLATAAFATASLTATTFATTLATTLATTAFATTFASRSHPHPGNCHPQRPHGHHLCRQRAD